MGLGKSLETAQGGMDPQEVHAEKVESLFDEKPPGLVRTGRLTCRGRSRSAGCRHGRSAAGPAYMSERLDQSIGLDELAELTSLSRSHFCTAFRHATGRTPHEWLTALRLACSAALARPEDEHHRCGPGPRLPDPFGVRRRIPAAHRHNAFRLSSLHIEQCLPSQLRDRRAFPTPGSLPEVMARPISVQSRRMKLSA